MREDIFERRRAGRQVGDEIARRDGKQLDVRLRRATFEGQKRLEDFEWGFNPGIPRARIILAQGADRRFEAFDREAMFRESAGKSLDVLLDEFAAEVRARERHWLEQGISGVPAVILDGRHLIEGAQPPEAFEQALRQVAASR